MNRFISLSLPSEAPFVRVKYKANDKPPLKPPTVIVKGQSHRLKHNNTSVLVRELLLANFYPVNSPLASAREVAYVSTFPPKKCGIATFTADLVGAVERFGCLKRQMVVSVDGRRLLGPFIGWEHKIRRNRQADYTLMADYLNRTSIDAVNIQHEFGIFGGQSGEYICSFLERIKKPVATTLHTVLPNFTGKIREVFQEISEKSAKLVVLNGSTRNLILDNYSVPPSKVTVIPHGCPDLPLLESDQVKPLLGLQGKMVLSTFGLLSRGKGIEYALEALPEIVKHEPRTVYLMLGQTHPQVKRSEGEEYRQKLQEQVKNLGLEGHVRFFNRFLSKPDLYRYLQATDVYLTPYLSPDQVSSGALCYALAAGKAVVSTPYLHAKEALGNGRGLFCDFHDSASIAEKVDMLIGDEELRRQVELKAYEYSRAFTWQNVAKKYLELFEELNSKQEVKMPSTILR